MCELDDMALIENSLEWLWESMIVSFGEKTSHFTALR